MIDRDHKLSIKCQAQLLGMSCGAVYYLPQPTSPADWAVMRRMGIAALAPQPGTRKKAPGHKIYPYLLRRLTVARSNQVWALDTTYIAMARGFVDLTAVMDVFSRRVLAHKVVITLQACHAKEVMEQAFARWGGPEIVNTDQGSPFTASELTEPRWRVAASSACPGAKSIFFICPVKHETLQWGYWPGRITAEARRSCRRSSASSNRSRAACSACRPS